MQSFLKRVGRNLARNLFGIGAPPYRMNLEYDQVIHDGLERMVLRTAARDKVEVIAAALGAYDALTGLQADGFEFQAVHADGRRKAFTLEITRGEPCSSFDG